MKKDKRKAMCCVTPDGVPLAFHLCCAACRHILSAAERARLMADGTSPAECGPDMVRVAPARGPVRSWRPTVSLPDGEGGYKLVDMGYRDRAAMIQRDVFDVMTDQALRRGGVALFTRQQVGVARDYRALCERIAGSGVKCSRTFDVQTAGQGRIDFMDAYMRDTERQAVYHRSIGTGVALQVRAHGAHSMDRGTRRSITDRDLVDMICITGKDLSATLRARGWSVGGKNRKTLHAALCAALDRMVCI